MSPFTAFLFSQPTFFEGMARGVDFGGLLSESEYNVSETPIEADFNALFADWCAIAEDFRQVVEQNAQEAAKTTAVPTAR